MMYNFMRWLFLVVADILATLTAWVVAPVLPLFALDKMSLPKWLSWFDTPDNPLDGDEGFITLHAPFKGNVSGIKRYVNRVCWLWRNPAYGFSYNVLGANLKTLPVVIAGNDRVSDSRDLETNRKTGLSGFVLVRSDPYFEFYFVRQYKNLPHCFRLRLGWKLLGFIQAKNDWPLTRKGQFVLSVKPYGKFDI